MNNKGISLLILDIVIVVLLALVVFSFTLPTKWQNDDMTAVNNAEKTLATLQVAIDIYQTRNDGKLPGGINVSATDEKELMKEGLQAIVALIADIKTSNVLAFDEKSNPDDFKNYFADVPGTHYRWDSTKKTYEIVVFSKDRKPFKFICTNEKIVTIDPQKELIQFMAEVQGFENEIMTESAKIGLYKSDVADRIPQILEELSKIDMTPLTSVFAVAQNAKTSKEIETKKVEDAKEIFRKYGRNMESLKSLSASVNESMQIIGGISIKAEDKRLLIKSITDSLVDTRLKSSSEKVFASMKKIEDLSGETFGRMTPIQEDINKKLAENQAEISKFEEKYAEYKMQMTYVTTRVTDLIKKENDDELAREEQEEKKKKGN